LMPTTDPSARRRVAVVVLNYRTPELSAACARSALADADPARDVVIVVDNASEDDSAERLRSELANAGPGELRIVESGRNGGFAFGNNTGMRAADADAYLLLNSDTVVRPGAVETLYRFLESHPRAGLVGPRLEWETGEPQQSGFRFHRPLTELIAGSATGPIQHLLARWDVPLPVTETARPVEWVSFAGVMIRSELIRAAGLMDEGYFMYFEDADYGHAAARAGFEVWQEPAARIVHLRGQSSPVKRLHAARQRLPRYYYASRARYFRKNYGRAGWLAANLLWTAGRCVAWLRETLGNKEPHTVAYQMRDNWRG
ncbi:MAG TPA: glycosyltransferase family 2 protein, partial [Myxococcota bacterium]|nr:glycosyltransferase family 2 protein [Myxococcota bacterium]